MLSNLFRTVRGKTKENWYDECRSPRNRLERRARLSVECLEGRLVPSTFVVTNPGDSGPGTLRQAILDSNQGGDLNVIDMTNPTMDGATIALMSALPDIGNSVTIIGGISLKTTVTRAQGAPDFRIFTIFPNSQVFELKNLIITGGSATDGGGIWSNGILTLENCVVQFNTAAQNGGGIYQGMASLNIEAGTEVSDNTAGQNGGGLYFESQAQQLQIGESTFTSNTAAVDGGGVYYHSGGHVTITGSAFTHNTALGGKGGAICCDLCMTLSVSDDTTGPMMSMITDNFAQHAAGVFAHGFDITLDTFIMDNRCPDPDTVGYLIELFPGGIATINFAKVIDLGTVSGG